MSKRTAIAIALSLCDAYAAVSGGLVKFPG